MVANKLLSRENEMSPTTVADTKGKVDRTIKSKLDRREDKCSLMSVSSQLEPRKDREKIVSPAENVKKYRVRVKNLVE